MMVRPEDLWSAIAIAAGIAIIGMFLRIEHRLTKLETSIDSIRVVFEICLQRWGKSSQ